MFRILFSVFFITNSMLWAKGSSAAVPFGTLVALLSLWLFISIPLSFIGSFFGFKAQAIQAPTRTNQIPRQVRFTNRAKSRKLNFQVLRESFFFSHCGPKFLSKFWEKEFIDLEIVK
jgi:hypothetical protein